MPDSSKSPKVLLLDLGRVVFGLDWKRPLDRLGLTGTVAEKTLIHGIQTWPPYDRMERGAIGLSEFVASVNEYVGKNFSEAEFGGAWIEVLTGYEKGMEQLLDKLRGVIPLHALTNTTLLHYEHMIRTYDPLRYFKSIFTSFDLGYRKPERQIFEAVLKRLEVSPAEVLFIDDTATHVEAAKRLGIQAFQLREGESLAKLLASCGIVIP